MGAINYLPRMMKLSSRDVVIGSSVFKNNGIKWLSFKPTNLRGTEIFPTVFQNSPGYVNFKLELLDWTSNLQEKTPYIQKDAFTALRTDMDAPSSLAPIAPDDNTSWRERVGCRKVSQEDKELAREIIRLIIRDSEPSAILHREVSSSGAPFFIKGSLYKKLSVSRTFSKNGRKRLDTVLKACEERSSAKLVSLDIMPLYTQGERKHFVKSGKERVFLSPEALLQQRYEWEKVDFKHPRDGRLHCYDRRSMYAANNELNFAAQVLNNALMNGFKKCCAAVDYKGEKELSQELKALGSGRVIFSLDKEKFGETMSLEIIHIIFEELKNSKYTVFAIIAESMMGWPTYYRNVRRDKLTPILSYDPSEKLESFNNQAFKSGHGMVAFFGKFLGVLDAILMLKDTCSKMKIEFDLQKALANNYKEFWFKNSGDDTIFSMDLTYKKFFNTKKSLHKDIIEEYCLFLGYYYTNEGEVNVALHRFLLNRFLPERGYRSKALPKLGFLCAYLIYKEYFYDDAILRESVKVADSILEKHCGFRLQNWLDKNDSYELSVMRDVRTDLDLLFITNPDLIHYKIDAKFVSEDLRNRFYKTTEVELFEHLIKE